MSWWIIDTVSINEDGDESLCDIQCDTAADLPAADQTGTAGYTIVRGSKALDLATGDRYIMNSLGSWVQQPSEYSLDLTGYATKSWVTGELAGYVPTTTYTTDQAAISAEISAIANDAAKNRLLLLNYTAGQSATVKGRTFTIQPDGGIKIENAHSGTGNYADLYLSGTWAGTSAVFTCGGATYRASIQAPDVASGSKQYVILKVYDRHTGSTVDFIDPSAAGTGSDFAFDATVIYISIHKDLVIPAEGIIVYPMIRRAAITDSSYQPYAPTNRELYEMILALQ